MAGQPTDDSNTGTPGELKAQDAPATSPPEITSRIEGSRWCADAVEFSHWAQVRIRQRQMSLMVEDEESEAEAATLARYAELAAALFRHGTAGRWDEVDPSWTADPRAATHNNSAVTDAP